VKSLSFFLFGESDYDGILLLKFFRSVPVRFVLSGASR